jgi:hypothetical protein
VGGARMTTMRLNWVSTNYPKDRFFVKGTELATALCGAHSRFQICETRILTDDKEFPYGERFDIRDAATVSDAESKAGVRPKIIKTFFDVDDAIAYCMANDPAPNYDD